MEDRYSYVDIAFGAIVEALDATVALYGNLKEEVG